MIVGSVTFKLLLLANVDNPYIHVCVYIWNSEFIVCPGNVLTINSSPGEAMVMCLLSQLNLGGAMASPAWPWDLVWLGQGITKPVAIC